MNHRWLSIYNRCRAWFGSKGSEKYLYSCSFIESFIFPIPPDVLLAPLCAYRPQHAMRIAAWTTLFSTLGGLIGYGLGWFAIHHIMEWWPNWSAWQDYPKVQAWFDEWGAWVILVAGFSPIPYKLFTIAAGAFEQSIAVFILASLLGRGARFFIVAYLAQRWGVQVIERLMQWGQNPIGIAVFILLCGLIYWFI